MKLMVVDDSNIIRSRIERVYEKNSDVKVIATASNGRDAVEKAARLMPDIITMDLTMPGMGGLHSIKHIVSANQQVKILVVSALSDIATGLQAIENGARGFLCKPFTDEELIDAINKMIQVE
jgi:two-component system, chemotaxis family, chemotaxis protein CheY